MAEIQFEVKGTRGSISVDTFYLAVQKAIQLLREFDSAISGLRRGTLRWYVQDLHSNGGLALIAQSHLRAPVARRRFPDRGDLVAISFVNGFDDLEHKCVTPPYLSEAGMSKAADMVNLIGRNGASGFSIKGADKTVEITSATSENISKLLPIKYSALGSVEGNLEKISIHTRSQFVVYHSITKRAITCLFEQERFLQQVKDALGHRVSASGTLLKNYRGETLRVNVDHIRIMEGTSLVRPDDQNLPSPDFTDAADTAELLRRIRGG